MIFASTSNSNQKMTLVGFFLDDGELCQVRPRWICRDMLTDN